MRLQTRACLLVYASYTPYFSVDKHQPHVRYVGPRGPGSYKIAEGIEVAIRIVVGQVRGGIQSERARTGEGLSIRDRAGRIGWSVSPIGARAENRHA